MSDPVSRRARIIDTFLRNLRESKTGWTIDQCTNFIVKHYEYGIRRGTASGIVRELVELNVIYRKGSRLYFKKA